MTETETSILVVDDDVDICRNLADILSDLGHHVETAHDGPSALELVRSRRFDVALLDLKMPGMDGLQLYREIKRLRPSMVALIVSAYATRETADDAKHAGAWQVLAKPVDLSRLLPLIDEAVAQPLVLVVDDDPDLCDTLWDVLRDRGYRVGVAHAQAEATRMLGDAHYRVVLIDMRLPDASGEDVFHTVRRLSPDSRVILVTGFRAELNGLVHQVLDEGADAICYKPFDVSELLTTLNRLAAGGRE
jgi:DNA-binding NtrC family response regulator